MKNLLFLLFLLLFLSGCWYQTSGIELYPVSSTSVEGKKFVKEYSVEYLSANNWSVLDADVYRGDCSFVVDVVKADGKISYKKINDNYIEQFQLTPQIGWWDNGGVLLALGLGALLYCLPVLFVVSTDWLINSSFGKFIKKHW